MLGDALRVHIEAFAAAAKDRNALYVKAIDGQLTPAHLARYLANIHQLVLHTPVHLRRARAEAARRGDASLAAHFERRLGEEEGHDVWAARDLQRLGSDTRRPPHAVAEGMRALLAFIARTIDEDPALYLAYILFAEYLTVLMGPAWLELLEERCGIPRAAMSVIGNHAELDKEHVQEALEEIDDLVGDPAKLPRLRSVLDETFVLFDRFCDDVTSTPEIPHERSSSVRVTAQLSVA
jgi:hypothetical protein